MNELHLFAGSGGGILGGMLLGHTTVCAVEIEPYCRKNLLQRQRDGILPRFPIWDDVTTFDGKPWRGLVDIVCGGFPCQDISCAGRGGESQVQEADSGQKWPESFVKYDHQSASWKTHHYSLFEDFISFSETWPQWGIMLDGECWELTMLEATAKEIGFGFWGRPTASDSMEIQKFTIPQMLKSNFGAQRNRYTVQFLRDFGFIPSPEFAEWLMGWPEMWSDIKPLEMDKVQSWQQQHSGF